MKMRRLFYGALAAILDFRPRRARETGAPPRILLIRRNRMGDMICTLPLLHALRRQFPKAHLAVACDAPGVPIAQACSAVDQVILLRSSWNRWQAILENGWALQDYDWVIAAKAGFDQRLAMLVRLTNAPRRIGYEATGNSAYYTDPVAIDPDLERMHQIEATLGLLAPLGAAPPADPAADLKLTLPRTAIDFAERVLSSDSWTGWKRLVLINLSSTTRLKFSQEDFGLLAADLASRSGVVVGLVGLPADQARARQLADQTGGNVRAIATPGPLELAALLQRASVFVTAEGGAAHLAAAMGTPTIALWSGGPFEKWHSRGPDHVFLHHAGGEVTIARERVLQALAPYLSA